MRTRRIVESTLFAILLIVLWQILYMAGTEWLSLVKPYSVPNPLGVGQSFIYLVKEGTMFQAIGYSMFRAVTGFVLAVAIGIALGVLILQFGFLSRNLKPLILGIQTLPSICWVPFAILWFGLKESAIIFVVVMGSAFSIALAVESSVKNVPPIYLKAAKTMGVSPVNLYLKVIFPAALPAFVNGLKQGWSFAWRALMSGEVMSATVGLGYTLMIGRDLADINQVTTVMLVIIALGIVIDKGLFSTVENHLLRKRGLLE